MTGIIIDLVLGVIVFTGVMIAFHRQHRYDPVPLVINDELLHRMTVGMRRLEQSAQSVGVASRQAAKAFSKFGVAFDEYNFREWPRR